MKRTERICLACGNPFYGSRDNHYCPTCAKTRKTDTVVRPRICQDCGTEFLGGPRAKRCPDCAHISRSGQKRHPAMRPIGSIDNCVICGEQYTVNSGRQKYCSESCQREGVLKWQREHKKTYHITSGQNVKKQERREKVQKICAYCLCTFASDTSTNLCSAHCRSEQRKLSQCMSDIKRGYNRDLKKYEEKREQYRRERQNDRQIIL